MNLSLQQPKAEHSEIFIVELQAQKARCGKKHLTTTPYAAAARTASAIAASVASPTLCCFATATATELLAQFQ